MSRPKVFLKWLPVLVPAVIVLALLLILGRMEAAAAPSPALALLITPTPTRTSTPSPTPTQPPAKSTPTPTRPSSSPCDPVISKRVEPSQVRPGDEVLFTIEVTNRGQAGAVNVYVVDDIPEYLEILDVNTSQGTWKQEGQKITVEIGVIGEGYVVEILIHARVRDDAPVPLSIENVAVVRSDNCPDPSARVDLLIVGDPDRLPVTGGFSTWWLLAALLGTGLVAASLMLSRRSQI